MKRDRCRHGRSEEHTSELQSHLNLVCRLLLEKKNTSHHTMTHTCAYAPATEICGRRSRVYMRACDRSQSALDLHVCVRWWLRFFFFNDTATTEIYTLSLHDALPI